MIFVIVEAPTLDTAHPFALHLAGCAELQAELVNKGGHDGHLHRIDATDRAGAVEQWLDHGNPTGRGHTSDSIGFGACLDPAE